MPYSSNCTWRHKLSTERYHLIYDPSRSISNLFATKLGHARASTYHMDIWSGHNFNLLQKKAARTKRNVGDKYIHPGTADANKNTRSTKQRTCPSVNSRDTGTLQSTWFFITNVCRLPYIEHTSIVCGDYHIPSDELWYLCPPLTWLHTTSPHTPTCVS